MELDEAIRQAAGLIASASSVVAFTGAGISVESGIPDFRSSGGLWSKYDPDLYCSSLVFNQRPELFWEMAIDMQSMIDGAKPNPAHYALAELESMGKLKCVITQNVDNLHKRAGSKVVFELHGNGSTATCTDCKTTLPILDALEQLKSGKKFPQCTECSGVLKMDVVLFGEDLPGWVLENAFGAAMSTEVLLVIGTSLTVSPANSLVHLCIASHGKVVICDPEASNSQLASVMLLGKAGEVLPRLVKACKEQQQQLHEKKSRDQATGQINKTQEHTASG